MSRTIAFLMACVATLTWARSAECGTLERIRERGFITMGYIKDAAPFSSADASGRPQGYAVDLCREVALGVRARLDLPELGMRWVALTVQDRLDAVRTGRVDVECSTTTWTLSRQAQVDFSLITFVDGGSILSRGQAAYTQLREFDGRKIAVIAGTTTERALTQALAQRSIRGQLVIVKSRPEGLKLLDEREVDGFASDRTTLVALVAQRDARGEPYALLDEDFSVEPYALTLARDDHEFRLAVNSVLARMYRDGDIVQVYKRWFGALGLPSLLLSATYFIQALPE
jgi:glutamate/aspartate transport system substrate-binding protein